MAEEPRPLAYYIWPFHIYTLAEGIMISGSLAAAECHAHINAHKPPKPVTPTFFMPDKKF